MKFPGTPLLCCRCLSDVIWETSHLISPDIRRFVQKFIRQSTKKMATLRITGAAWGWSNFPIPLRWRHNGRDGVPIHRRLDCLPKRLFGRRSKKTSKLRVTGLCEGNSPVTGEFPTQRASNTENASICWRHYDKWPVMGEVSTSWCFTQEVRTSGLSHNLPHITVNKTIHM